MPTIIHREWKPRLDEETALLLEELRNAARKPYEGRDVYFHAYSWCGEFDKDDQLNSIINIQAVGTDGLFEWPKVPYLRLRQLLDNGHAVRRVWRRPNDFDFVVQL